MKKPKVKARAVRGKGKLAEPRVEVSKTKEAIEMEHIKSLNDLALMQANAQMIQHRPLVRPRHYLQPVITKPETKRYD